MKTTVVATAGIVLLIRLPREMSKYSAVSVRQICVGDICIAAYVVPISRQTSGRPAFGTEAIATGMHRPMIVWEPETMEPKKKISINTINVGIGSFAKKSGRALIAPEAVRNSFSVITANVFRYSVNWNEAIKFGLTTSTENL